MQRAGRRVGKQAVERGETMKAAPGYFEIDQSVRCQSTVVDDIMSILAVKQDLDLPKCLYAPVTYPNEVYQLDKLQILCIHRAIFA